MKKVLLVFGIVLLSTGCDLKKNVNETADTINQAADTMNEIAAKTTKVADIVNDTVDKAEEVRDQAKENLAELQKSWNTVKTEVEENVDTATKELITLKGQMEEILGTSFTSIEKTGNDLLIKLNDGQIFKLDLFKTLEPQLKDLEKILQGMEMAK